jgi:excisionase family DNA binding protein
VTPDKIAVTKREAAERLSMSVDHFERHVQDELKVTRSGRLRLFPVRELERWAERNAAAVLD